MTSRRISLTAISAGTTFLEAKDANGRVQAALEVTVKEKQTYSAFVHFVFDKSGRSAAAGLSEAEHMIDVANKIYLPQANIELSRRDSGPCRLPFDLPQGMPTYLKEFSAPRTWLRNTPGPLPCIASRAPGQEGCLPEEVQGPLSMADFDVIRRYQIMCNLLSHVDRNSDYNIFIVRSLERDPGPYVTRAYTPSSNKGIEINACIIPNGYVNGQILAHEFGHYLLRPKPSFLRPDGHSTGKNDLMQDYMGPDDLKIPKEQANYMNGSGRQYDTW
jgi:hypothetical protein